ncbi:MAG: SBBP repeat-containing protein [Microcoleaceae cyanobacterium MO_207.B10]|nr:SBBP repeat-containing protein [Microcoleaceae cyanobacterium MO_207.B10]
MIDSFNFSENEFLDTPYLPESNEINNLNLPYSSETFIPELEVQEFQTPQTDFSETNDPLTGLSFMENVGQINNSEIEYLAKANNYDLLFSQNEIIFGAAVEREGQTTSDVVKLNFPNANPNSTIKPLNQLPGVANFFQGNNSNNWHTNIPTYGAIEYENLYPGIDLIYSSIDGKLKRDFIVAPETDTSQILLNYSGVENISILPDGSLLIDTELGELSEVSPIAYQEIDGQQIAVEVAYQLLGNNQVGFNIGEYNQDYELIIDPTIEYSTLIGGNGFDRGNGIAVDVAGNVYITGDTTSVDFPTLNAIQPEFNGGGVVFNNDAFVTKLDQNGTVLWSTYFGGSNDEFGIDIAVDLTGGVYVTGNTNSLDFLTVNAFQTTYGGGSFNGDAFVTKLSSLGNSVQYSTYLGGRDEDISRGIAVDNNGNAYVTGSTGGFSPFPALPVPGFVDFPTTENAFQSTSTNNLDRDAFVTKLSGNGKTLVYSTLLSGLDFDAATDIDVDNQGNAYLTGSTRSFNFPIRNAIQPIYGGDSDIFITKLNRDGSDLLFSTFYGRSDGDSGSGIAVDLAENIYVTGTTGTRIFEGDIAIPPVGDFPTFSGFQNLFGGGSSDGIVMKINRNGSLGYGSFLGGNSSEFANDITVDDLGNVYVTGSTASVNFPIINGFQEGVGFGLPDDAFISKVSSNGLLLDYSATIGGVGNESGNGITIDPARNIYVVGFSDSVDFPVINAVNNFGSESNVFVAKIESDFVPPNTFQNFIQYVTEQRINPIEIYFDEDFYLANNSDVVRQVQNGLFRDGLDHFINRGQFQGRNPSLLFDETVYLIDNPEVRDAVANGVFNSGFEHFINVGFFEGRDERTTNFDERFYLASNPLVALAVENGVFNSGFEHFILFGEVEGRSGNRE